MDGLCRDQNADYKPHPKRSNLKSGYDPPGREAYHGETTSEALVNRAESAMRGTSYCLAPLLI